ncbi:MAG: hypothetical protein HY741_17970 [Chloroflexi bacterium]|nr:hypothetical protein [Chloroflexota bacterium]
MESRHITTIAILFAAGLTLFLSGSVFGCIVDDNSACVMLRSNPLTLGIGGGKGNAMMLAETDQDPQQAELIPFITNKLRESAPQPKSEVLNLMTLLPRESDAELDEMLKVLMVLDTGTDLVIARRIAMITQEQTRRLNERLLAQQLAQQAARRKAAQLAAARPPAPAPAPVLPGSPDPYNAPTPSGAEVYIQPHTAVWYSVEDRGRRLSIWMNANHQSGLELAIFGPDQQDVWSSRPTGKAAPGQGFDFFWTGRSRFKGTWRLRVTNTNDFSVPYTLGTQTISDKNGDLCRDCHGVIEDEWERCEHDGSFCEDLKDQYKN